MSTLGALHGGLAGNLIGLALWALCLGIVFWRWAPWSEFRDDIQRGSRRAARFAIWLLLPPLVFLLRGLFGELGFAAPVLVFWLAVPQPLTLARRLFVATLALTGIVLLISALGSIATDLYGFGYSGHNAPTFLFAIGGALTFAWFAARPLAIAWLVGISLLAAGITPSPNLWDTLIDLPTTVMAVILALRARRGASAEPR